MLCSVCRETFKLYHVKRKPCVNMDQKRRRVLWAEAHLKWTVSSVLWTDESKFDILVGNHRRCVLRAKEERDLAACYQRSVQKPASLMVWGCISAYGMGSLHVLEGFRATYAFQSSSYILVRCLFLSLLVQNKFLWGPHILVDIRVRHIEKKCS